MQTRQTLYTGIWIFGFALLALSAVIGAGARALSN
jgi:hypothetical protein